MQRTCVIQRDWPQPEVVKGMDAFGQQLYDHHRGLLADEFREVGERDDGNIQVYEHPRWYFTSFDE